MILCYVSFKLINEIRKLIVGESIPRDKRAQIKKIIHEYEIVDHINRVQTMVIGNDRYLVLISVDIDDDASGYHIEDMFEQIKLDIKAAIPEVADIYIDIKDSNAQM